MGLFDRFKGLKAAHSAAKSCGDDPFAIRMDEVLSPTEAMIEGRHTILAGTNNYLGLTFEQSCVEASAEAVRAYGTGTTGSRVANGSYAGHKALEDSVADFFGRKHAMVFTTGYQANLGIIATLAGPQDYLIIDSDSHASIYDATRLSSATVLRFKHNDPDDLDRRLSKLANEAVNKVIVVEGIYSMRGDIAPLAEFAAVKRKHGAYLVVDEAHSMGVMGDTGRGAAEFYGVEGDVDFIVGTFSKSLGAIGGYCVSDHPEFDILRVACRPYMFTASLPPSIVASVAASLEVMKARPTLRDDLWANVNQLYGTLQRRGFVLGPHKSPGVAVHLPDPASAIQVWHELLLAGVYVNLTLPPATPNNVALLRCSVCAAHTSQQLAIVADRLTEIAERYGLIGGSMRMAAAG
ncbi:MAG: aminotransferase class I/II-fold pyridoxal phosphate-dependent enzyme [Rhodospirillaceae bacterium]|nr:aminotransferase class I/II-fold pyridoxal phosphate-dependent enzyme [Rhodospirillaceae bacterium]